MQNRGWVGLSMAIALAAGCQQAKKPVEPPPPVQPVPTTQTVESARESFKRVNPSADVGAVVAVIPESNLAAIGDIPVGNFHEGDPISFLDGDLNTITIGSVVAIVKGNLHVHYEPPAAGHRPPQLGDLAVRVPNGVNINPTTAPMVTPGSTPSDATVTAPPAAGGTSHEPPPPPAPDTSKAVPAAPGTPPTDAPAGSNGAASHEAPPTTPAPTPPAPAPTDPTPPAPAPSPAPPAPDLNK